MWYGERFLKEGFVDPKPLIKVFGKPMIYNVVKHLLQQQNNKNIIKYMCIFFVTRS